jgi:hypothetical protein
MFFEFDGRNLTPQPDIPDSLFDGGCEFLVLPSLSGYHWSACSFPLR